MTLKWRCGVGDYCQLEYIRQAMYENEKTMRAIERDADKVQTDATKIGDSLHDFQRLHGR